MVLIHTHTHTIISIVLHDSEIINSKDVTKEGKRKKNKNKIKKRILEI